MIEKPMPQDILKFTPKAVAGLTIREAFFVAIGALGSFLLYPTVKSFMPDSNWDIILCTTVAIGGVIPIAFGFIKPYGQPLEKVLLLYIKENVLAPAHRYKEYRHPEMEKYEELLDVSEYASLSTEEEEEETSGKKKKPSKKSQNSQSVTTKNVVVKRSREYKGIR